MGAIKGFIDSALTGTKNFITKKVPYYLGRIQTEFLNIGIPKYKTGSGKVLRNQFYDTLNSMADEDIPDFIQRYSADAWQRLSNTGGNYAEAFRGLPTELRTTVLKEYGTEQLANIRMENAINALEYGDAFNIGTQGQLQKVYETINSPEFKQRYYNRNIELGRRGIFEDFRYNPQDITPKQRAKLDKFFEKEFANQVNDFNRVYVPDGADGPNLNYGLQQKFLRSADGRVLHGSYYGKNRYAKKNNKLIDKGNQTLGAYKDYLGERLRTIPDINGERWEPPTSFRDYAINEEGLDVKEVKNISKQIAMGDPDHSGIGLWELAKRHPIRATVGLMGVAWGASEMVEDDSL